MNYTKFFEAIDPSTIRPKQKPRIKELECYKCLSTKVVSEFYYDSKRKIYNPKCKKCQNAYDKQRRRERAEEKAKVKFVVNRIVEIIEAA